MKIRSHYSSTPFQEFEGDAVHGVTGRVVIGKDDGAANFCMRIFTLAPGGYTPRHSHDWEHEILIHEGHGQVMQERQWGRCLTRVCRVHSRQRGTSVSQ